LFKYQEAAGPNGSLEEDIRNALHITCFPTSQTGDTSKLNALRLTKLSFPSSTINNHDSTTAFQPCAADNREQQNVERCLLVYST
jgi:hypothetical protein